MAEETHHAFASLRVSVKVIIRTSLETRSEVFLCLGFVSYRQSKATRSEDKLDPCEVKQSKKERKDEMRFMKSYLKTCGVCVSFITCISSVLAQSEENSFAALDWKKGPTTTKVGYVASQKVNSGCMFLEAADARKFLELNQNPSSSSDVGIIVSDKWWARY